MVQNNEQTAEIRAEREEARWKDIYAGEVRAGGEVLIFQRERLFDDKFSVMLPNNYVALPDNLAKIKYPNDGRPGVIKTNADTTVNFAFAYYAQQFSENQVETAVNELKSGIIRLTPGLRFLGTHFSKTDNNVAFGWFDFISATLDSELYQLFGFVPVHGKFLQVIFNAPAANMRSWLPVVVQVLKSIKEN